MIHNSQGTLISNGEVPSRALIPFDPQLVTNSLLSRKELMKSMLDPRRDVNTECGYPETHAMNAHDYKQMYEREGVASRVVELEPLESWTVLPQVYEDEDEEAVTEFELGWKHLCDNFDSDSWFKPKDDTHPVWEYLLRADILSGIGHFGALLMGLDDGKDLREPVGNLGKDDNKPTTNVDFSRIAPEEREAVGKKLKPTIEQEDDEEDDDENESEMSDEDADPPEQKVKLLYLQAFDESLIQIMAYEDNKNNPRFGQPVRYQLTLNDPVNNQQHGIGLTTQTVEVHWSRVIHVADNCTSSRVFGKPRQRPVWNRLLDCRKIYSSSGEGYWQGAFPGIALETHPQLGGDVTVDIANTRKQMYDYTNSLQRYIALAGMSAKTLNGTVTAPGPHVDAHIDAICIQLGCPKRIFIGSERGELASSQDSDAWDDRIGRRRYQYLTPRIIVPFVDRLIQVEVLPQPKSYCVTWDKADQQTATDRAAFATQITTALSAYVSGGVDALMSPKDYLIKVCKFDSVEVDEILENALEHVNEANPDSEDVTVPGVQPTPPAPDVPDIIVDADGNAQPNPLAALGGKQGPPTVAGKPPFAKKSPVGNTGANLETMGESGEDGVLNEYADLPAIKDPSLSRLVLSVMDELAANFNPNQPRDSHGKFGSGGGGSSKGKSVKKASSGAAAPKFDPMSAAFPGEPGYVKPAKVAKPKSDKSEAKDPGMRKVDSLINSEDVLKDLKLPPKLYHVTSEDNLKSIQKTGLVRSKKTSEDGENLGTYLSNDPHEMLFKQTDLKLGKAVVLEIDTSKLKGLRLDPEFFADHETKDGAKRYVKEVNNRETTMAMYSRLNIPASAIKVSKDVDLTRNFNPNQPRDSHGRFGSGGGKSGGGSAKGKGMPSKSAISGLTKIQNLGGSTGATLVKDADGNKYVMKKGASPEHLRSEYAAENAYRAAGANVPDSHLYETPDGPVKLSKFIVGKPYGELKGAEKEAARKQIQKDFAADAAFANWDVHGYGGENILVDKKGTAYRIDAGGALAFRAQGGPKGDKWNKDAGEFDTMRNGFQKGASSLFGDMTKEEISASFAKLDTNSTKVMTALNNSGAKAEATMVSARLQSIAAKIDKMPDSGKTAAVKSSPVITSEKLSAVAAAAASGTKPFSGNHSLTNPQTLADYVKANAGDQNFTKLKLEKMKFLNPDGLKNGTLFVPEAENKIMAGQLAQLAKIMPPGTQLKVVKNLSASKIGLDGLPGSNSKVVKNSTVPTTANPMAYKEASEVVKTKPTKVSPLAIKAEELNSQHKLVKEWKKNLNNSEQSAISSWKGSAKDMRKAITSNPPPPPSTAIDPKAHHFYKAIEKAPQIQGQVWRGVDGPYSKQTFDIMKAAGVGGEWSDTAPHCMSRDKSIGISFGKDSGSNGLLLHLKTKTGRSIEYQSSHSYEQEVTGMPNTRYRILKIKDKPSTGSSDYGYHEVHLEEI